ncbi:MAG: polysaccharide deacetylase family protein, partial [Actinomycetia bacterium]|nr:polysaccharide deacetylase family protein [Actinomycetes bacterium]
MVKRSLNLFIVIIAVALLLMVLQSCKPETQLYDPETIAETEQSPLLFTGSHIELIDLNGGDLYPGEAVQANITIVNSSQTTGNNIEVKLLTGNMFPRDSGDDPYIIEYLEAGRSIEINIPLKIMEGLTEDTGTYASLVINEGTDSEYVTGKQDLTVFGVRPYERNEIPIIGLHAIEDEIDIPIELSTYHFEVLCRTLKNFGFETITFNDLLDHLDFGRALPEKSVILTSDDGFGDLYANAFPILRKYGYKMSIFLVTGFIKETEEERVVNYFDADRPVPMRPMLIWPEVKEMYEYGCEFLSHSTNHIRLGLATEEDFLYELSESKENIESRLGNEVMLFAWPYDNNSKDKWPLIPEAGYRGAVRYWGGIAEIDNINLNEIRRVEFNSYIPPSNYAGYLSLHDIIIEGHLESPEQTAGEPITLEYTITNNDSRDLKITSLELEPGGDLKLDDVDPSGYISQ